MLNALILSGDYQLQRGTVFNMAVKAYGTDRKLKPEQMIKYTAWRQKIIAMIKARDPLALRPGAYDALLGL